MLQFYLQLVSFDVVTSTFIKLDQKDRDAILEKLSSLKETFERVLPKLQDIG